MFFLSTFRPCAVSKKKSGRRNRREPRFSGWASFFWEAEEEEELSPAGSKASAGSFSASAAEHPLTATPSNTSHVSRGEPVPKYAGPERRVLILGHFTLFPHIGTTIFCVSAAVFEEQEMCVQIFSFPALKGSTCNIERHLVARIRIKILRKR